MSTSGSAARVGAAAFVVGLALGAPLVGTAPLAAADTDSPSVAEPSDTGKPARTPRGPRETSRGGISTAPRAAAVSDPADDSEFDTRVRPRRSAHPEKASDAAPSAATAPVPEVRPQRGRSVTTPLSAPVATVPAAEATAQTPAQPPAVAPAAPPAIAAPPAALTTPNTPAAAATSSATGILNGLFGSFRGFFEGAALLWRRRLFNEAPTVNPVQLTGLADGPITGTIGAVDPEGDPLLYTLIGDPRYGVVTVGQDGSYTYTPGTDFAGSDNFVVSVTDTGRHINLLDLKRPKSTDASVAVAQGELAPLLRFQFIYGSGSQHWSSEARNALESAASKLAGYLVVTSPVTVTYAVTGQSSPLSSTLASAGSDFTDVGTGFMQTVVQKKIQTGIDPNGSTADGEINWNFGPSWAFGDTVGTSEYDFQSTAMHELVHTLGFLSYIDKAGNNFGLTWTEFDGYVVDSAGTAVIGTDYKWKTAYNTNLTGGNGGLYFGGPNAVAAYGGPVPLYTPSPYSSGSSMSHLDDGAFTGSNEMLMNAVYGRGRGVRELSSLELSILSDIGYQLAPSGASSLMIVGFFLIRRPRRSPHTDSRLG